MENLLVDELLEYVLINGKKYGISYGFRTSILFELLMQDPEYSDAEKILYAMDLYYPGEKPDDLEKGLQAVLDFYHYTGKEETVLDRDRRQMKEQKPLYSFEEDAPYIYAAFLQQYGIDLNKIESEDLHWWKFSALFQSLGEDMKISKIMYYRDVDLRGKSKGERTFLSDMKKRYALKCSRSVHTQFSSLAQRDAKMKAYVERRFAAIETR